MKVGVVSKLQFCNQVRIHYQGSYAFSEMKFKDFSGLLRTFLTKFKDFFKMKWTVNVLQNRILIIRGHYWTIGHHKHYSPVWRPYACTYI